MYKRSKKWLLDIPRGDIKIALLIWVCAVIILVVYFGPTDNWSWDPSYYYAQLRSPIIDHDLDFRGETETAGIEPAVSPRGLLPSPWPIGPSVLWSPFFLIAHAITSIFNLPQENGFSAIYIAFVSVGSVVFSVLGLIVIYRICRFFTDRFVSLVTTVMCLAATPLLFYTFRQPIMAHTTGLFAASMVVLVFIFLDRREISISKSGLLFGIFCGLTFLTRWVGLLILVFPIAYYLDGLINTYKVKTKPEFIQHLIQIAIFVGVFLLTISPQLALWYRIHGQILIIPQQGTSFVNNLLPMNLLNVLFSTNRGLLLWSPFVFVSLVGIFFIPYKRIKITALVYLVLLILLLGYRTDWFGGGGFGPRYFIESLPVLVIGFVSIANPLAKSPWGKFGIILFALAMTIHQLMLVHTVEFGVEPGWVNLTRYVGGKSIGFRFQINSLLRLIKNPSWWIASRPYLAEDRQTLLVSLFSPDTKLHAGSIQVLALVLSPVLAAIIFLLRKTVSRFSLHIISVALILYLILWALYILLL